ncbi:MAG: hypothetical protein OEY94_09010 [Alphaproteobacteria bacterium]|nr:hypothetical protein [Alphaproteobacteria bacterium]
MIRPSKPKKPPTASERRLGLSVLRHYALGAVLVVGWYMFISPKVPSVVMSMQSDKPPSHDEEGKKECRLCNIEPDKEDLDLWPDDEDEEEDEFAPMHFLEKRSTQGEAAAEQDSQRRNTAPFKDDFKGHRFRYDLEPSETDKHAPKIEDTDGALFDSDWDDEDDD